MNRSLPKLYTFSFCILFLGSETLGSERPKLPRHAKRDCLQKDPAAALLHTPPTIAPKPFNPYVDKDLQLPSCLFGPIFIEALRDERSLQYPQACICHRCGTFFREDKSLRRHTVSKRACPSRAQETPTPKIEKRVEPPLIEIPNGLYEEYINEFFDEAGDQFHELVKTPTLSDTAQANDFPMDYE